MDGHKQICDKFMDAVKEGDVEKLKKLTETYGFSRPQKLCHGYVLLKEALSCGQFDVAKLLLTSGAKVNDDHSNDKVTPLHLASGSLYISSRYRLCDLSERIDNLLELVEMLLSNGASVDARDEEDCTPLHHAASWGKSEIALSLLSHDANVNCVNKCGDTPLHCALKSNNLECVQLLLRHGANVDVGGSPLKHRQTPLHVVIRTAKQNDEAVKLLLRGGASVNVCDNSGSTLFHYSVLRRLRPNIAQTPLHIAIDKQNEEAVKLLLRGGASVNFRDNTGSTPLHYTVLRRFRPDIAGLLLSHSANVNACNKWGETPLLMAVNVINEEAVKFLLSEGASIDVCDKTGLSPLHYALEYARYMPDTALLLLTHSANVNACNSKSQTPLHIVVKKNYEEGVKLLLSKGANVDVSDQFGSTPLHYAVEHFKNTPNISRLLVSHSANVNACNKDGQTPLHMAVKGNQYESVQFLLSEGVSVDVGDQFGSTPLHYAVGRLNCKETSDSPDIARLLVSHSANVNACNKEGQTPLHIAVKNEHEKCVELLLKEGANVDIPDSLGLTSLHYVATISRLNIARLLVPYSANVNAANVDGETPLHVAVKSGNKQAVELFLSNGGSVDAQDGKGSTPLHYAVEQPIFEIAQSLVLYSANVNAINNSGVSPLHIAVRENNEAVVKLLLDNSARVQIVDENPKQTLLHMAVRSGQVNILNLLLEHGANVDIPDENGYTILFFAVALGHMEGTGLVRNFDDSSRASVIDLILKHSPDVNNESNSRSLTAAVMYGSRGSVGYIQIIERLLEYGFTIESKDKGDVTLLHTAIGKEYEKFVEEMLKCTSNVSVFVNSLSDKGFASLHVASMYSGERIVNLLVSSGSDVNACSLGPVQEGFTPLHFASKHSKEDIVKLLLSSGSDVNARDKCGKTPLFYANDVSIAKNLLNSGASVENCDDTLFVAVKKKCYELVKILLHKGANVNAKDKDGMTALHLASKHSEETVVKLLLSSGSDVNAIDKCGNTPLFYASDVNIAKDLLNSGGSAENCGDILLVAVKYNCTELVKILLHKGASVDAKDKDGMTALHFACSSGYENMVEILLERGANVNSRDVVNGYTALHFAAGKEDHVRIIAELLKHGADIDAKSKTEAPLRLTDFSNTESSIKKSSSQSNFFQLGQLNFLQPDTTEELSSGRAATDISGKTPLYVAVEKGLKENVSVLLTCGADINIRYIHSTPLMCAEKKHSETVAEETSSENVSRYARNFVEDCSRNLKENWHYEDVDIDENKLYEEGVEHFYYRYYDCCPVSVFTEIIDVIDMHILLLKSAGFFVAEGYLKESRCDSDSDELDYYVPERRYEWRAFPSDFYSEFRTYRKACEEELGRTKNVKIGSSNSSLYDILVQSPNELAALCNKENFPVTLESDFINRFSVPIYGNMIRYRLYLGKERIDLLKNATVFLSEVFFLPDLCIDTLSDYLGNTDLKNFIEACQHSDANFSCT